MKKPTFHGTKFKDPFEFIIDCYDNFPKISIMKQNGVKFVTFL